MPRTSQNTCFTLCLLSFSCVWEGNTRMGGQKSDFCFLRVLWQVGRQLSCLCLRGLPQPTAPSGVLHPLQLPEVHTIVMFPEYLASGLPEAAVGQTQRSSLPGRGHLTLSRGCLEQVLHLFSRQVTLESDKHRKFTNISQLPTTFCF